MGPSRRDPLARVFVGAWRRRRPAGAAVPPSRGPHRRHGKPCPRQPRPSRHTDQRGSGVRAVLALRPYALLCAVDTHPGVADRAGLPLAVRLVRRDSRARTVRTALLVRADADDDGARAGRRLTTSLWRPADRHVADRPLAAYIQ